MATISIPERVYPGFMIISELDNSQLNKIVDYLSTMVIGEQFDIVAQNFNIILNNNNGSDLLKTIISFSKLVDPEDVNYQDISNNLSESFVELSGIEKNLKFKENLSSNLLKILTNYNALKNTIKSRELASENENNFGDFKLLTDIRLIFNDEIENKNRCAVILHKLTIEYQKDMDIKELHLTLDLTDLSKLKSEIEKAILKDQIIREDYKENLNFIS